MKNKVIALTLASVILTVSLYGCGSKEGVQTTAPTEAVANDGETGTAQAGNEEVAEEEIKEESEEEIRAKQEAEANEYYEKGRADLYGLDGNEISLESAYANFEKAKELGKQDANFYLGLLCDWYAYPEEDFERAKAYYEDSGENPYAITSLGILYFYGQGVEEDKAKAEEMFQAVIEQGCAEGYLGIADKYYDEEDYPAAFEAYNKTLEGKEQVFTESAMNMIGYMYHLGEGVEQDSTKAMEWYEKATDSGNSDAMNNIGYMYRHGDGVEQDYTKAMEWYEKAADSGNSTAMYNIGYMYMVGEGVEQDYEKAMEWYEKAADSGNSDAMNNIGHMYGEGEGVEQDYEKAMEWYEKAADSGNSNAMNNIGYMYHHGEGVEQDYEMAMEWYEKAAVLGNEAAKENMKYLK